MVPLDIRLRYDGQFFRRASGGWVAKQEFDVVGTDNPADAAAALALPPWNLEVDAANPRKHPKSDLVYLESLDPQPAGFQRWFVNANWSSSPLGFHPNPGNPLNDPPIYRWRKGNESVVSERDTYGNPIINTAFDLFERTDSRTVNTLEFAIKRNEPIFNPLTSVKYSNTVNSAPMIILGVWTVDVGQVLCQSIEPSADASKGSPYTPVIYKFFMRAPLAKTVDSDGLWDSFKTRKISVGHRAWFDNGGTPQLGRIGTIVDGQFIPVSADVPLDDKGKPIGATYVVERQPPIDCPVPLPSHVILEPSSYIDPDTGKPVAWFLKFLEFGVQNFGDLNL